MAWYDVPVARLAKLVSVVVLVIVALLSGMALLVKLWSLVVAIGVALLLGAALLPAVETLARVTKRRTPAVVTVMLLVVGGFALFGWLVAPPMVAQSRDLYDRAPEVRDRLARFAEERGSPTLRDRILQFSPGDVASPDQVVRTGLGVAGFLVAFFTVFFLTMYFLFDAGILERFLYFSTPRGWHPHIRAVLPPLQEVVGGYVRGQAITSLSIGVFSFVMLTVLGVPNALALAGIAMIADLIPLVGVFILMVPMVLSALAVSLTTGLVVFGLMMVYQQFEDRLLIPRIYGSTLRLPTIAVVAAILAGAELLGVLGAFLALPVAAAIRVVVEYAAKAKHTSAARAGAEVLSDAAPPSSDDGEVPSRDMPPSTVKA